MRTQITFDNDFVDELTERVRDSIRESDEFAAADEFDTCVRTFELDPDNCLLKSDFDVDNVYKRLELIECALEGPEGGTANFLPRIDVLEAKIARIENALLLFARGSKNRAANLAHNLTGVPVLDPEAD